jgi:NADP-dependent 3-hydroxy acid dehydrogenase YdfG
LNKERVACDTGAFAGIGAAIAKRSVLEGLRVFGASRKSQHTQTMVGVEMLRLDVRFEECV